MKVLLEISFPDSLAQEFMQILRDFDMKHDPKHEDRITMRTLSESNQSVEEMKAIFAALRPPFEFTKGKQFDS